MNTMYHKYAARKIAAIRVAYYNYKSTFLSHVLAA